MSQHNPAPATFSPLMEANLTYDALAARLGFKRQLGTRERLVLVATKLLAGGMNLGPEYHQFNELQRSALRIGTEVGGPLFLQYVLNQASDPSCSVLELPKATFDFWEQE